MFSLMKALRIFRTQYVILNNKNAQRAVDISTMIFTFNFIFTMFKYIGASI